MKDVHKKHVQISVLHKENTYILMQTEKSNQMYLSNSKFTWNECFCLQTRQIT